MMSLELLGQASPLLNSYGYPIDISTHGGPIDDLMVFTHWFMLALFVGWGVFFVYCLVKFRARPGHRANYELIKAKPSKYVEVLVIVVEAVLLLWFSMPAWAEYRNEPPAENERFAVDIVAQQFAWNVHYPGKDGIFGRRDIHQVNEQTNPLGLDKNDPHAQDDFNSLNHLYIPKDKPVYIRLSSKDVIHSFAIPVLRVKQDVLPGMHIPVWFEATRAGEWDIQCAQLCGNNHYKMKGRVHVLDPADFEKWSATAGQEEEFIEE